MLTMYVKICYYNIIYLDNGNSVFRCVGSLVCVNGLYMMSSMRKKYPVEILVVSIFFQSVKKFSIGRFTSDLINFTGGFRFYKFRLVDAPKMSFFFFFFFIPCNFINISGKPEIFTGKIFLVRSNFVFSL